jgi:hypothetical protein
MGLMVLVLIMPTKDELFAKGSLLSLAKTIEVMVVQPVDKHLEFPI